MSLGPLLDTINSRVTLDKEEGDIAYFHALMLQLEYITKLTTASVLACIVDDSGRERYSLEHALVRADGMGEWADSLNSALTGPTALHFMPGATSIARQLTERVGNGDWRYRAVHDLHTIAERFGLDAPIGAKAALRQLFQIGAAIRNRTRGHGATTGVECSEICPLLVEAIESVAAKSSVLSLPWAYLHRNLSGKYRVSRLLGDVSEFEYLKRTREVSIPNGVYMYLDGPVPVPLVFSDPSVRDIFVPNGNFRSGSFEALSYVTDEVVTYDGSTWLLPPGRLPPSETEGQTVLEPMGNVFANIPPKPLGYVVRTALEKRLRDELFRIDSHPIISLTGPGGIGKTSIAIATIEAMTKVDNPPYDVVVWLSARDIDLLDSGPKPVTPRVVKRRDLAQATVELLNPRARREPGFQAESYLETCLRDGTAGSTLFVLDNFETVENPGDVFAWVDTHIRPPNKVLITTRFREFVGDYPIKIEGMTDDEAHALISGHASRLGIASLLDDRYKEELIRESDGHPYVIKILLGQVAKERRAVKPERIVAASDHLLTALFERTYDKLTPAAQRIFLLLCSWRVFVPAVAVEAVSLRKGNERFDVASALDELRSFALVDEVPSEADDDSFVGVPLAAASYGRRKLEASPFKVAVELDRELLKEFGASRREGARSGVLPGISRLVRSVASRASENPESLENFLPVLEYLASRIPEAYLMLSELVLETEGFEEGRERAKTYLRRFLETADTHEREHAWVQLARLCHSEEDAVGEVHALGEAALQPTVTSEAIGTYANGINGRIRDLKGRRVEEAWSSEVKLLIERVANAMERQLPRLSATNCSRLAWLYLNIGNDQRAREIAKVGAERDPENHHCQNLIRTLGP